MSGTGDFIYKVCDWIMRLAVANLLWMGGTLAGALVFGAYPSFVACLALIRCWAAGERPVPLRFFWKSYKAAFVQANTVLLINGLLVSFLLVNIYILLHFDGLLQYVLISIHLFVLLFLSYLLLIAAVPLGRNTQLRAAAKETIYLAFISPKRIVVLALGLCLLVMLVRALPGVLPLFSVNLVAALVMLLYQGVGLNWNKGEQKAEVV
ncbi:YesL family protein [Salsuginibacillus kocurii]|uniref:YesL family protein n=1 Tax=Salsuginibacillus kocurii TaxID=427078 RepID=UPI0003796E68|nr:DUF624 domain-containing protein [Salsuginibacillus kocurii]